MTSAQLMAMVDFLKEVPLFSEVEKISLLELCKESKEELFLKNHRIIQKGEVGDGMYLILKGKVKVHDKEHDYGSLSKGEFFGEYALIDKKPRSVSVTALEETTLLKIEAAHFLRLIDSDKGFVQGILSVLIKRHRELDVAQERLSASKKQMELAHSQLSGLIQYAMDAIIMFDGDFRIVLANDSAKAILENDDVELRNILYFLDEESASLLEKLIGDHSASSKGMNTHLPNTIKVIGSNEGISTNEGTISSYGNEDETYYTLILRSIDDRIQAERKISTLTKQTEYLQEELKELKQDHGIIAQHASMLNLLGLIDQVAPTQATVLIHGETGTGKELVARAIHNNSNRANGPMVRINCGAIPANLIESELFGHEKGAFTGATNSRKGRFLLADKGTIFLDEIGELPLELQPKLLRVIQEGEFDAVGSSKTQKVDVRIVAATHRDLLALSKEGKFREDLFYRLNVFPIEVPPLRDRGNDVCLIADKMIEHFSKSLSIPIKKLNSAQRKQLLEYNWPGNVRELQNLVERAVIVSKGGEIDWSNILPTSHHAEKTNTPIHNGHILTSKEMLQLEKDNILKALKRTKWKVSGSDGAAALLGLPSTTLASKIKAFGLTRPV
ncbi:sigma 54-interacting transcriptional regulator [Flagellimonas pelagia]|uniref:Cyclic nucleotide-binding domain-containing protein n=1 Tax=Flagellimonas pelagia TaxID=2306998 RepID=A0A3A1NIN3_9FLAO|nr:sigma 54-interacting transcriptional regulator [Allomuricauda maritima]RIV42203.1 PAS domain S-box protein [Allomuricauda maritima]TXJ91093.1 cyclic nucleotide-binding domain-containing protein [Allomuricauda maritima]